MKRIEPPADTQTSAASLIVPLRDLNASSVALAGGKAAQLGALLRAGFAVPDGFCLTTAAYARMARQAQLDALLDELAALPPTDTAQIAGKAAQLRSAILQSPVPADLVSAVLDAYRRLPHGEHSAVAVRSSATAEDLPGASFAGQQETMLNVIGEQALLAAVQRCWASLWSERAAQYRAQLGIDPRDVQLAVVVQPMVDAQVAGVLFTANPLTGRRREAVIDANPGLGEAVVSGATIPDHFVVDTVTGAIRERMLGDKRLVVEAVSGGGTLRREQPGQPHVACLSDSQVGQLAALGARVEQLFGAPVDIEWALDGANELWLLQARPITTLFPLPAGAQAGSAALRVYLSFTVQQGTYQPFTPIGIAAIKMLASGLATFLGQPPRDTLEGPAFVTEAASRIFLDVTGALRRPFGRAILSQVMAQAEAHAATIFAALSVDPRLAPIPTRRLALARALAWLLIRTGLPWRLLSAVVWPSVARAHLIHAAGALSDRAAAAAGADPRSRLAAVEQLLLTALPRVLSSSAPIMAGSIGTLALAQRLLGRLATAAELQIVMRSLPGNPTTEMNMALWALAQKVRADRASAALVRDTSPEQLAGAYHAGQLAPALQAGLAHFLATYGHRSVNELDLGVARWSEDPAYLFGVLAGYLRIDDPAQAPDRQLQRAAQEAEAMLAELTRRAAKASWARGILAGFLLGRARALGGMRELPRSTLAGLLAQGRALLLPVGAALAQAGRLSRAEDIFWLTPAEARSALDGADLRAAVGARRAQYEGERRRRHVPLVLLSDGTEPAGAPGATARGDLLVQGTPASPGTVTARARVIHDPLGAELEPGEILVAPTTDPGWTPLFLRAGGLVMETGGAMAHGAIVAREYGIPAVVGAAGATTRIATGQRIAVDGSTGTVALAPEPGGA